MNSITLLGSLRVAMRQWRKRSLSELLYARTRLKCLCVCIPKHILFYPVVWHPLIHRAVLLSQHHNLITVTLELSCALGYDPSPTQTRGSASFYGTETPVFEHL